MNRVSDNRTAYKLRPGRGYKLVGPLPMPPDPLGEPAVCEPPAGTPMSKHKLLPPADREGALPTPFIWHPDKKEWECSGTVGKRVAFTSAYLAAHGWTYGGPG